MSDYYRAYLELDVDSDALAWCCNECGALVGDKITHDEWHKRQEAPYEYDPDFDQYS